MAFTTVTYTQQLATIGQWVARQTHDVVMLVLGLDNLKLLAPVAGLNEVDRLVAHIAREIAAQCHAHGHCMQWAQDEFVIMIPWSDIATIEQFIGELLHRVQQPFVHDHYRLAVSASLGWHRFTQQDDLTEALRFATVARLLAQQHGGCRSYQYQPTVPFLHLYHQLCLDLDMQYALATEQFFILYQPKINQQRQICGVEALIRWQHPQFGLLSPQLFIERAERSGVIVQIGEWVLDHVCQQIQKWKQLGEKFYPVAINLSALQFEQPLFLQKFRQCLQQYNVDPKDISIEITETVLVNAEGIGQNVLKALNEMGVKISLDDFGNGYSNFSYLAQLQVDEIKIDRSMMLDIEHSPIKKIILKSILDLAHHLKLNTVAEGVETAEQAAWLFGKGCQHIQGFWFSPPISAAALQEFFEPRISIH